METSNHAIIEEHINFRTLDGLVLEGVLAYPESTRARCAVLLLGPHPHFGGNLNNNVIKTLAQGLANAGAVTLRFNYRGVGKSEISLPEGISTYSYFEAMEQNRNYAALLPDAEAALQFIANAVQMPCPPIIIGYSFGALLGGLLTQRQPVGHLLAISPPVNRVLLSDYFSADISATFLGGDNDFTFKADKFHAAIDTVNPRFNRRILANCDHFYRGKEKMLLEEVRNELFPSI